MPNSDRLEQTQDLDLRGGSKIREHGVEFALFSRHATKVELCLFNDAGDVETNRFSLHQNEDHIWRGFLPDAHAGLKYGYRVDGPFEPVNGHWFNPYKLLVDPFARELYGSVVNDHALFTYDQGTDGANQSRDLSDNAAFVPKSVVTDEGARHETDHLLRTPLGETIIYELHVAGYSKQNMDLPEKLRGTFEGLTSAPILQHMQSLGITAVELLPVFPFNDEPHLWPNGLSNYWGYNPYNFFAPDPRFGNPEQFRAMVRRFHQAGIEVLLDIVYNHTGEGDVHGPTLSLRGIDNASYYRHLPLEPGTYVNDTGCGNTLDLEHPYVREMVLASLRHWSSELGVDGFRFDLAPILGRSSEGFSSEASFFKQVQADPALSSLKLIAEPWDIGPGGYQLGQFPSGWSEWNDKYRDTVRAFWRGDDNIVGELAGRMSGSKELFSARGRAPQAGINFITAHDGFTLHDLVSYNEKHNEANGENNADGHSHNISRNYGVEGETQDRKINDLRQRQKRNMLATLFLSQGVPMLQAGDELGRSQSGNNNSYCQDNEINWIDWQNVDHDLTAFVAKLSELRRTFPQLRLHGFLTGEAGVKGCGADVTWLSPTGDPMQNADWELPYARCFGFHLAGMDDREGDLAGRPVLVLLNAHFDVIDFKLPSQSYGDNWHCLLQTDDLADESKELKGGDHLSLAGHSFMVLAGQQAAPFELAEDDLYCLSDLCEIAGIEPSYSDLSGQTHHLSDEAKLKLLSVLHTGDLSSRRGIDAQVRAHIQETWQALVPSVTVLRKNADKKFEKTVIIHLAEEEMGQQLNWIIRLENGGEIEGVLPAERLSLLKSLRINNQLYHQLAIVSLPQIPLGYHQLELSIGDRQNSSTLIIAPTHCYHPQWMEDQERVWGVAHQIYSLGGHLDKGIGDLSDLGDLAFAAGQGGADVLGVSPLHALFPLMPERISPYSPSSRLALNSLFLDVTRMDGFIEGEHDELAFVSTIHENTGLVDYQSVAKVKGQAFEKLYNAFLVDGTPQQKSDFAQFCFERGQNLRSFATFCALAEHFDGRALVEWPSAYRDPASNEVTAFAKKHEMRIYFHSWVQWQADQQLARASKLCTEQGMKVGLYGDLAVGAVLDGAECWAHPEFYLKDISFGAPPDAFNADGQNWCMPPFNPQALREAAYQPFIDMLRENMRHCGALRMDHVMWLQRMFVIPLNEPASSGAYIRYPFDDLLAILALESTRSKCIVVGEDLGTVPHGFRGRMEREYILSYRLMRFEKEHDGAFIAPQNYPYLALATPSSHDLPTLRGFFAGDDLKTLQKLGKLAGEHELRDALKNRDQEIQSMIDALKGQGFLAQETSEHTSHDAMLDELVDGIGLYLGRSNSAFTMLNLEDLAGSFDQVNVPGTVNEVPNWRHRLSFDPATLMEREHLLALLELLRVERGGKQPHVDQKRA